MKPYFATLPVEEIGKELYTRVGKYYEWLETSGRYATWKGVYDAYYAGAGAGGQVRRTGEKAEFTEIQLNQIRNLGTHTINLATEKKPSFDARATNTDTESIAQSELAQGILDYYLREKRLERHTRNVVEYAWTTSEGSLSVTWNSTLGDPVAIDPDTGSPVNAGDIEYQSLSPLEVIRDPSKTDWTHHRWLITREPSNRYDLIAQHQELADELEKLPSAADVRKEWRTSSFEEMDQNAVDSCDDVYVYTFYHQKTPAVPEGRTIRFAGSKCVFLDGPLPYDELPVYRMTAGEQVGTQNGYSVAFDLLPIQQAQNGLDSIILSNQAAFGTQSIAVHENANVSVSQLSRGLNVITYRGEKKPEPLNLTSTPREIFEYRTILGRELETLSGVNSVARGNPDSNLKSGAALALVQSQAIQFSSGLQNSYVQLLESVGTATIRILQQRAQAPRVVEIAGKANKSKAQTFTGADIAKVKRVTVDVGNALSRTAAGRFEMAQFLAQNGVADPQKLIQVIATGKLEVMTEGPMSEMDNIRAENEQLRQGLPVPVIATDNPIMHIMGHKVVLDSPEARSDPRIAEAALMHIQEHLPQWEAMGPVLRAALNIPDPPMPMPMPMDPSMAGPPPEGEPSATPPPEAGGTDVMAPTEPEMPGMPRPPVNPLTGQPAEMPQ